MRVYRTLLISHNVSFRTFFEMRARKSERTKFLNSLWDTLVRRMDEV
ncbi:RteC domain-containing protein [Flavobacterium sp. FlaQc-48]